MNLGCLRALLPDASMLVLTATIPFVSLHQLKEVLMLKSAKIVMVSPDRPNIYLRKSTRLLTKDQHASNMEILDPIAKQLNELRHEYPVTLVYMKLK